MSSPGKTSPYILGLDLGSTSIGWAMVSLGEKRVLRAGVRIFSCGMSEEKFAKGEEGASNSVKRRQARLHRRQLRRRAARQRDLFTLLQSSGLLPPSPDNSGPSRQSVLTALDAKLYNSWRGAIATVAPAVVAPDQVLPYFLRAHALDHRLELFELGRILYHLSQRRGYKSNRKEASEPAVEESKKKKPRAAEKKVDGDDPTSVLASIKRLAEEISSSGSRTLGEHFSRIDPAIARIRNRWTSRDMYIQEFEQIWAAQRAHYPDLLTPELRRRVHHLLFYQRPLMAGRVGRCELEKGERRAPKACLLAQEFRLLQKVNDLRVRSFPLAAFEPLQPSQRQRLYTELMQRASVSFAEIRQILGLPYPPYELNLESGTAKRKGRKASAATLEAPKEKRMLGNKARAAMLEAFGSEAWNELDASEQDRIMERWRNAESGARLAHELVNDWALAPESAQKLAATAPEEGYLGLSLKAISRLLPLMREGRSLAESIKAIPEYNTPLEPEPLLPAVADALPHIPNPAVMRSLTELRKVVNAIVREHGKPAQVRIELARDLKRTAEERNKAHWDNKDRQAARERMMKKIMEEGGIPTVSGADIEKGLLWEECKGECVYCGRSLGGFADLFSGDIHVEHILPKSRFPDDGFSAKTLACHECNKQKSGRTPFEAFGSDAAQWEQILRRVDRYLSREKQRRFRLENSEKIADFAECRMNDTRYTSRLARRYIGLLYGGLNALPVEPGKTSKDRKVFATSGALTAGLRRGWGLEAILGGGGAKAGKGRGDHRHHAVDAIVIALTTEAAVQRAAQAAATYGRTHAVERVSSRFLQGPWENFVDSVRPVIEQIQVSHRAEHKLSGELHAETIYSSWPAEEAEKHGYQPGEVRLRRPVHLLSVKDIEANDVIVDTAVRTAVQEKLRQVGGKPEKLEHDPPRLKTRTGKEVPILKVRCRQKLKVARIGQGVRQRYVSTSGNHHVAIYEGRDDKGRPVWDAEVVSLLDAHRLRKNKEPIVRRNLPEAPEFEFKFSLMGGDMVEMEHPKKKTRGLFVLRTISQTAQGRIELSFADSRDARLKTEIIKSGDWIRQDIGPLRKLGCRKVAVDPLGRVMGLND